MFLQRFLSTLLLVPLIILALFYAPAWFLGGILFLILSLAGRECWQLIPLNKLPLQVSFLLLLWLGLWACTYFFNIWLILGLMTWALLCFAILTFPQSQLYWGHPIVVGAICFVLLPLFIQSLIHLYFLLQGKSLLLYLFFLIWASDIGAYITGKRFGKHRLIPQVSPGKSWEGVLGGLILAVLIALSALIYFKPNALFSWLALALITVIISIFGDLFISILKRRCHLKDTGSLIPGHGGILDRLDSLIAAAPLFYFGLSYFHLDI